MPVPWVLEKLLRRRLGLAGAWLEKCAELAEQHGILYRDGAYLGVSTRGFHRIAYVEWGDIHSEEVVICVHGLSRQGRDFDVLATHLARAGSRVICVDLPGRGRSDWLKDSKDYTLPQYVADLTGLIARLGVSSVDWIGTSMGGIIGIIMAGQANSPVKRLIVNDIGPLVSWRILQRLGDAVRDAPPGFADFASANAYFRATLHGFGDLSDQQWNLLTQHSIVQEGAGHWRKLNDPGIVRPFQMNPLFNVSIWNYWDMIRCPTLILRGETSDVLPEATASEMTTRGPQASLVTFDGCGHAPALMDMEQIGTIMGWLAQS